MGLLKRLCGGMAMHLAEESEARIPPLSLNQDLNSLGWPETYCVARASLEPPILLPLSLTCWDYRCELSCPFLPSPSLLTGQDLLCTMKTGLQSTM